MDNLYYVSLACGSLTRELPRRSIPRRYDDISDDGSTVIPTEHTFTSHVRWLGPDRTAGSRRAFSRAHVLSADGVPEIAGSAAKVFHGDSDRWNPEQLLLSALAQCHMMTFLFLAQRAGLTVTAYEGSVEGTLSMDPDGIGGEFSHIMLFPVVTVSPTETDAEPQLQARVGELHTRVKQYCFIARSVQAPIDVRPETVVRRS